MLWLLALAALTVSLPLAFGAADGSIEDVYQSPEDFISEAFPDSPPKNALVWLDKETRENVEKILGHPYAGFRIRYWTAGNRTAWILEEIGKVKPITTGIVVEDGQIVRLKPLIYRESHGWEVKYPFFTDQFTGAALNEKNRLSQPVDGIAGATLSVNALKRLARLALYLHEVAQR